MIIKTKGTTYECVRAEQHKTDFYLYLEDDKLDVILQDPVIKEVIDGEIVVVEAPDTPENPPSDTSVWDELDQAYQEGYQEGVDSV